MVLNNQNHINYNYMNYISNHKGEKNEDMELEENKNNISLPERTNYNFVKEENQKSPKIRNPKNIDSKFSYNIPFIANDININNNLIPQNENKYPFFLNNNKFNINILNSDNNRNQLQNLDLNNQSRFTNFFSKINIQ